MNILKIAGSVLKTAASVAGLNFAIDDGNLLEKAASVLEHMKDTPEMRQAMASHETEMKRLGVEEMKVAMSESMAMIASDDKFVKRARPTGLYIFYACSLALVIGQLAGADIDPTAILTILGPLAGVGGTYVYKRTQEKLRS